MRRRSKNRSKKDRSDETLRSAYRDLFPFCQLCGNVACDVHEIARGGRRVKAQGLRCCLLHLCRPCHDLMGDYSVWTVERQLRLKKLADPEGFDLGKFQEIYGRQVDITEGTP